VGRRGRDDGAGAEQVPALVDAGVRTRPIDVDGHGTAWQVALGEAAEGGRHLFCAGSGEQVRRDVVVGADPVEDRPVQAPLAHRISLLACFTVSIVFTLAMSRPRRVTS
jgi:hypothetical protein